MTEEDKDWIDRSSYRSLLWLWRHASADAVIFKGDTGDYYARVMREKREAIGEAAAAQLSKEIGWGSA